METLQRQVRLARQRLAWQQFLSVLVWCWFGALVVATCGIAVAKLWPVDVDDWIWSAAWIGGSLAIGAIVAAVWTWVVRRDSLDAALEIDRRFGLKERVSSALALDAAEAETEAGRALVEDAVRRAQRIDVADRFQVALSRRAMLPLLPALAAFALAFFVENKAAENAAAATQAVAATRTQIKQSTEVLERKLAERKQEARDQNLKDAEDLFQRIEDRVRDLAKQDQTDRQNTLVKLNDLSKELDKRRQELGADDKLKQQLDQLKNLQQRGPADKLAAAMKNGDFKQALEEAQKLKDELANQNLNEQQRKDLAAQLEEMQQKLQKLADAHQQAKQDLEDQIKQARDSGNLPEADKLQQQLDKLTRQTPQMDRLRQLASKLGKAAQGTKDGKPGEGQAAMDQLAAELQQMEQDANESDMLQAALDQISQAKDAMNCKNCNGLGCDLCQGQNELKRGHSRGRGGGRQEGAEGDRGEEKTDTAMYDSKVDQNVRRGSGVLTDMVEGPNVKGQVRQEIKSQMDAAARQPSDPLNGQKLPRGERDHAQQYFDSLREGN